MIHLGDITKISGYDAPVVDVVIGGSPCQDLSVAGKRAGMAGERSGLYMEQIRIIKEMRQADVLRGRANVDIRPRYMVWENVPGAFSSNGGKDFAAVIEEAIRASEPEAPDVPVPEKGWPTSGILFDEFGRWSVAWRVLNAQFWGVPQRRRRIALVADFGGRSAGEILFEREGLRGDFAEGRTPWQTAAGDSQDCPGADDRDGEIRNVIPINMMVATRHKQLGRGTGFGVGEIGDPQFTVSTRHEHAVAYSFDRPAVAYAMQAFGHYIESEIASSLKQRDYKDATDLVCGVDCRNMNEYQELYPTLQAKPNGGQSLNFSHAIRLRYIVRRLTPLECERLQGFPDGWTDIGEWVDSKGKKHKDADSPRYKALGNSIAIPPWKWVLKRICACYERDATMASLFDGIGGFPYIWEQLNGKGSCLWASEIEEFPMAVTKLRFGG